MSGCYKPSRTQQAGLIAAGLVAQLVLSLPAKAERPAASSSAPLAEGPQISRVIPDESGRVRSLRRRLPVLLADPPAINTRSRRLGPGVKANGFSTNPVLLAEPAVARPRVSGSPAAISAATGISVSPNGGSSTSQTFTFLYRDPAGANDMRFVEALINSSRVGNNACFLHYDVPTNGLYLRTDANDNWLGPVTPGTTAFLANSQCTVSAAGTSVAKNGTDLSLAASITFSTTFTGTRGIWLIPVDLAGNAPADWLFAGSWNIPATNANVAPTATGVTPSGGTGTSQTFSFAYADASGFSDIWFTEALFNTSLNGSNACFIHYDRPSNGLYLRDDANANWLGVVTPGVPGSVSNSQCTIQGTGSSVSANGTNLVVNVNVSFNGTFTGTKNLYSIAVNSALNAVNWLPAGTWTVGTPPPNQAPIPLSVSPVASSGASSTFTFTYSDPNGYTDINSVDALFNSVVDAASACLIHYDRTTNVLYLRNDANNAWFGPITPGTANTLANSQCQISGGGAFVTGTGSTLAVTVPITFFSAFNGGKVIYLSAYDRGGLRTLLTNVGSFTVNASSVTPTPTTPYAISASPSNGGGLSQIFTFQYADQLGASDIMYAEALINNTLNGAGACYLHYNRASNTISLRDDSNGTWQGLLVPGTAGSISNSQCTVSGASSSVILSGNNLTFSPAVSFSAGFAGLKNLYLTAVSNTNTYPAWQSFGTYNVNGTGGNTGGGVVTIAPTSVFPSSASGLAQLFTFNYTDTAGIGDIQQVQATFSTPGGGAVCTVTYVPSTNSLYLSPTSGAIPLGPVTPGGGAGPLSNAYCSLNGTQSSVGSSGALLTLSLNMTFFQATFTGTKTITGGLQSISLGGQTVNTTLGTYTVGSSTSVTGVPAAVSVNYYPGFGFVATYRDTAGYQAIASEDMLINTTNSPVNACWIRYDAVNNLVYLRKDDNSGWLGGNKPGDSSTPTLSNSQCTVNTLLFNSTGNGTDVTDQFRMSFAAGWTGQRTVYLSAIDTAGNQGGPTALLTTYFP